MGCSMCCRPPIWALSAHVFLENILHLLRELVFEGIRPVSHHSDVSYITVLF